MKQIEAAYRTLKRIYFGLGMENDALKDHISSQRSPNANASLAGSGGISVGGGGLSMYGLCRRRACLVRLSADSSLTTFARAYA